jgi:hypothetical protein
VELFQGFAGIPTGLRDGNPELFSPHEDYAADAQRGSDYGADDLFPSEDIRLRANADNIRQQRGQDYNNPNDDQSDPDITIGHSCSFGVGLRWMKKRV